MDMTEVIKELRVRTKDKYRAAFSCWVVGTILGKYKEEQYSKLFSPDNKTFWMLTAYGSEFYAYTDESVLPLRETMVLLFGEILKDELHKQI